MKILVVAVFLFLAAEATATSDPKGDAAILDLALASTACAAVKKVNPDAVSGSRDYLGDGIALYQLFHDIPHERAAKHQQGMFAVITAERAIKAQALHSVAGAKDYLQQYLFKTDAKNCVGIRGSANKILKIYNAEL